MNFRGARTTTVAGHFRAGRRWRLASLAGLLFSGLGVAAAQQPATGGTAAASSGAAAGQQRSFLEKTQGLQVGRAFHSLAVLKDCIYAFGGSEFDAAGAARNGAVQKPTTSVSYARIYTNGQLSPWVYTTPMPEARHYINNSTLVLNDTVYIIGGSTAPTEGEQMSNVIWTRPGPDGKLEKWRSSAPFAQTGLSCQAAFSTPGYLWVTGGLPRKGPTSQDVYYVPILPDGSLGHWERSLPLPIPLWFHQAGVVGGRVYIWGGLKISGDPSAASINNKILSAPILNTGRLGVWTTESQVLPQAFYSASSANAGPYLFSFSPRYVGGVGSNDIWWTTVTQAGIQPWRKQATNIPMKLYHAVAPDYLHGSIYFVGGKVSTKPGPENFPLPWAVFFRLTPEARKQAEEGWMALQAAHKTMAASASTLELTTTGANAVAATPTPVVAGAPLPAGILTYETVRSTIAGKKPVVIYYRLAGAKPCVEQDAVLTPQTLAATKVAVGSSDIRTNPQLAQQFGVFRSPTWIFYDSRGQERGRHVGVISAEDLAAKASELK